MLGFLEGRPLAMSWSLPDHARTAAGGPAPDGSLAEIYSFYTHPDGWGTGVSAALMQATLRQLKANGFERVHLWTLRDTPQSRRFYLKCGFTETGATQLHDFGANNLLPQVEYERTI
ncbi:hypothetical protein GCM10009804_35160 [Kribbella hippodromi]|uniref:N-acetyltransferase domain-containing protein n=2 Tax=Kribbella hippodromi TaxID=434347 RepID=A0ABP4PCD8_9ACTN